MRPRIVKKLSLYFSFDGENFENVASSKCDHDSTFGLANYRGNALTTGSYYDSDCSVRTELYDFKTNRWNDAANYPFARLDIKISKLAILMPFTSQIFYYSVASTNEAAFVIGGSQQDGSSYLEFIAQFKDNTWSLYGNLQKRRSLHGSITSGDETMIIGGQTNDGS